MIDLFYWPTPNGRKVTILLEEAEIAYNLIPLNIGLGDQFKPDYLKLNPNHRMPAIVDHAPKGGGAPIGVFESGAIMMYLAEKAGKFWPQATRMKYEVTQWVMWQMANQGPKFGECGHFRRLKDGQSDVSYAVHRFGDEVNRLLGVMNNRLYDRPYMAGDQYTIADMICYPWMGNLRGLGQDIEEFQHVKRWMEELAARPALARGMAVGSELSVDIASLSTDDRERLRKMLYNQRALPVKG
jgi:GSH-dependent disulfide-bond oxidoreductase